MSDGWLPLFSVADKFCSHREKWRFQLTPMEKLHHYSFLFPLLLIHFSSHLLLASDYTLPDEYFISCGSSSNTIVNGRNFVGDVNPGSASSFSVGISRTVKDDSPSTAASPLYRTARIFRHQSSYEFRTTENGTYVVRFHFYPFSDLSDALFSVLASGFLLLSDFSVGNSSNSPVIKEFAVPVEVGKFKIDFTPQGSSFGFVNAIEAFHAPENFISDGIYYVTPAGHGDPYKGLESHAVHTIHRINVGGVTITPENDTLWRSWIPDDAYLYFPDSAKNSTFYSDRPKYQEQGATPYSAPDYVYKTAKEMNIDQSRESNNFNVTWNFNVNKNSTYFVRAHFCDIISPSLGLLTFNFYIYSQFSDKINPYDIMGQLAAPFYVDYVVDSDDSGYMNISIGPSQGSSNGTAFLNGLEIMELTKGSSLVPVANKPKKTLTFVVVGSVVGGVASVLVLLGVILWGWKCRKAKHVEIVDWTVPYYGRGSFSRTTDKTVDVSSVSGLNLGLKIPFSEILHATNNFDAKLMIGEGGFGKVYQGTLRNGMKVAIKRSEPGNGQGFSEFQTEIIILSRIRHRHLVSLIGYCDERFEMILVYEFMEKGTLRDHLYGSNGDTQKSTSLSELSWNQRLEICIGSARGLDYLHTGSDGGIIHRDVKSTNILLDEYYVAKVADFGLSKSGLPDQSHCTTDVKGSFGYLDPEYFRCLQLTEKSDIYSFGVVLLEVLCARPALDNSLPREEMNLAEWGMSWKNKGQLEKIVDPFLAGKINPSSLRKFGEVVEKCLRETGADRPSMRDVLWDLEYSLQLQQVIMQREKYYDSVTDASLELPLPAVQRLPSNSLPFVEDDRSEPNASEVFSQLRMGGGR